MARLSTTPFGAKWLELFGDPEQREVAALLMDSVMLVDRDTFVRSIRQSIETILNELSDKDRPIALFAEREVIKGDDGKVLPYFPNSGSGRATGDGVSPILFDPEKPEVGSEGQIANLITDMARRYKGRVISHPGPDAMRDERVRRIVIVTDFIGSGRRVASMLDAFRSVASLRSWQSYGFISFDVIAYSGTDRGLQIVRSHKARPTVSIFVSCPTIINTFTGVERTRVFKLCRSFPRKQRCPLGFSSSGALIAFAHGMPNNAPPILHSDNNGWTPLFTRRSTSEAEMHFPSDALHKLGETAEEILQLRNANDFLNARESGRWIKTMIVLSLIERGARELSVISSRTSLPIAEVEEIVGHSRVAQWTTISNTLTRLGRGELARLRRYRQRSPVLPNQAMPFYYPTQLRAR